MLEQLGKLIGAAAIALYALGFVAVNAYLSILGVTDFTLVRAKFIYTGALLAVTALATSAPILGFRTFRAFIGLRDLARRPVGSSGRSDRLWLSIAKVGGGLLFLLTLLFPQFILQKALSDFSMASWQTSFGGTGGAPSADADWGARFAAALVIYVSGLLVAMTVVHALRELRTQPVSTFPKAVRESSIAVGAALVVSAITMYVGVFMLLAYPVIPVQFSGGAPRNVRVLATKDEQPALIELGLSIPRGKQLSGPVKLVYDGSDGYVIRLPSGGVAQIDKKAVLGLVVTSP